MEAEPEQYRAKLFGKLRFRREKVKGEPVVFAPPASEQNVESCKWLEFNDLRICSRDEPTAKLANDRATDTFCSRSEQNYERKLGSSQMSRSSDPFE